MELKPCPFCGSKEIDIWQHNLKITDWKIECRNCSVSYVGLWMTKDEVIEAWNQRPNQWHKWPEEKPSENNYYLTYDLGALLPSVMKYEDGKWFVWNNYDDYGAE